MTVSLHSYQQADQAAREHALALEDDLAAKLRPLVEALVARALRNLRAKTRSLIATGAEWTRPDADELMNRHALEQELATALASFHSKAVRRVVNGIATELGLSFDLKNPLMVGVLAGQGQKITGISESLRREVMAQINDAWERGLSIPDTVALVTEHSTEFAASRATTIARCLPAEAPIDAAVVGAVTRRWYEGDMVTVVTESGREFTATPNHPMLTRRGWVTLGELDERDDLICRSLDEYAGAAGDQDVTDPPATISQVFEAAAAVGVLERRPAGQPDFHGDGMDGDVDIARPRWPLTINHEPTLFEHDCEGLLAPPDEARPGFCPTCGRLLSIYQRPCLCMAAHLDSGLAQDTEDERTRSTDGLSHIVERHPSLVLSDDPVRVHVGAKIVGGTETGGIATGSESLAVLDQPAPHGGRIDAQGASDPRGADPSSVHLDRVMSRRVWQFVGHVYNLSTPDGYFTSNGAWTGNTEIISASNQASLATARLSGAAPYKTWLATLDTRTRDTHAEANGQTVPINDTFTVGDSQMNAPGDPSAPPGETISCRCTILFSDSSSGDLQASGGRMADTAPTLTPMIVSIEGVDYTLPQPITAEGLYALNPDITDDHLSVLMGLTAAAPPVEAPVEEPAAPTAAIGSWMADPLIPYGVATRDGRMIRAGALAVPAQLPVPLMSMLEDVHGPSMTLPESKLAGAMTSFADTAQQLAASGTFDDTEDGRAAMQAVEDGRMGISADLAVTEYEMVMSQEMVDAADMADMADMPTDMPAEGDMPPKKEMPKSEDMPGGVVVDSGKMEDEGMFVVTGGEVLGATIVPFAAFDTARIELTTLAADGHPTHARVVMPLHLTAALPDVYEDDVGVVRDSEVRDVATHEWRAVSDGSIPAIAATLETLAASLRATAEPPRPNLDAEMITALAALVAAAQPDQSALVAALQTALSQPREAAAPQTTVINPPPITVHTPDVRVENHQPDVHVTNPAAKPGSLRVVRDKQGNAIRYETEASA